MGRTVCRAGLRFCRDRKGGDGDVIESFRLVCTLDLQFCRGVDRVRFAADGAKYRSGIDHRRNHRRSGRSHPERKGHPCQRGPGTSLRTRGDNQRGRHVRILARLARNLRRKRRNAQLQEIHAVGHHSRCESEARYGTDSTANRDYRRVDQRRSQCGSARNIDGGALRSGDWIAGRRRRNQRPQLHKPSQNCRRYPGRQRHW